jgi:polysaccharide export outer membrane protein
MIKKATFLLLFFLISLVFNSCEPYKHTPYFQDLPQAMVLNQDIENHSLIAIQPNDLLGISVSSLSEEAQLFTPSPTRITINTNDDQSQEGYLVNHRGEIQLPLLGSLKVAGLTTTEINELISKKLKGHLKEPVVNVRLLNFKVAVFGDVAKPGIYQVRNERITVLEAIILAGDLKSEAVKSNILLIRELDKKRQFIRLDIQSRTIFKSPYFYLKNNDMIYVEMSGKHEKRAAILTNANIATALVTFVLLLLKF